MIDKDFIDHLEEQIHQTVQDALYLKETVVRTVRENVDAHKGPAPTHRPVPPRRPAPPKPYVYPGRPVPRSNTQLRVRGNPGTSIAGTVMEIVGLAGAIPTGLAFVILALASLLAGMPWAAFAISSVVLVPLCVGFTVLAICGVRKVRRKRRFQRYQAQLNGDTFCSLDLLAASVGESKSFVIRDLQKMIRDGLFPEGHIDEQETCFIVTNETYRQYLQAQESARRRQLEEERKKQQPEADEAGECERAIAEGRDYLWQIREENRAIPGEEFSRKLSRLEEICAKIFDHVEAHPQKLPDIRKFMQYYLPTTLKLLKAYREFDGQPVQGENVTKVKAEISDTLDTINTAFENLLDSLFQDDVMDISTDISVLETMLAQEGLTEDAFRKKKP